MSIFCCLTGSAGATGKAGGSPNGLVFVAKRMQNGILNSLEEKPLECGSKAAAFIPFYYD
jgi:hypothetical protein